MSGDEIRAKDEILKAAKLYVCNKPEAEVESKCSRVYQENPKAESETQAEVKTQVNSPNSSQNKRVI